MKKNEEKTQYDKFLEEIGKDGKRGVAMFYSKDCPPCDKFRPAFDQYAEKFGHDINFTTVDIEEQEETTEELDIRSLPSILFFSEGKEACPRLGGYVEVDEFRDKVQNVLGGVCKSEGRKKVTADVLILGAGPAGLSAGNRLYTIVLDREMPGGQVATTYTVENYPGTGGKVEGPELMDKMVRQAKSFGTEITELTEALEVKVEGDVKHVLTHNTDYYAKTLIIATGAQPRHLPVENEEKYRSKGLHYCATCDGALYADEEIIVVGGGNSAVEEAVNLTAFASKITVVHILEEFTATEAAQRDLKKNEKIDVLFNTEISEIKGGDFLESVVLKNRKTGKKKEMDITGVFVFIGMLPRTGIFKDFVDLDPLGYILTDENMETSVPGVFACGDVRRKNVRQIANAAGDGVVASVFAEKYIASLKE